MIWNGCMRGELAIIYSKMFCFTILNLSLFQIDWQDSYLTQQFDYKNLTSRKMLTMLDTWYIEDGRTTLEARMRYVAGLLNTRSSLASKSANCDMDCSLMSPTTLLWLFTVMIIIITIIITDILCITFMVNFIVYVANYSSLHCSVSQALTESIDYIPPAGDSTSNCWLRLYRIMHRWKHMPQST